MKTHVLYGYIFLKKSIFKETFKLIRLNLSDEINKSILKISLRIIWKKNAFK